MVCPCGACAAAAMERAPTWYERLYAFNMANLMGTYEESIAPVKTKLFSTVRELASTRKSHLDVLEVGMGTGPNLKFYGSEAINVTALDPNPAMTPYAVKNAAAAGVPESNLRFVTGVLEERQLAADSFDFVVCTLTLCSVPSQRAALAEIQRVLKPGGKLLFVEHVLSPTPGLLQSAQRLLNPVQNAVAGCNLTRETGRAIQDAGFATVELDQFHVDGVLLLGPHVAGSASRAA